MMYKLILLTGLMICYFTIQAAGDTLSIQKGLKKQALDYLHQKINSDQSLVYVNVPFETLTSQLEKRILAPHGLHQGRSYFCWAAIPLMYLFEHKPIAMIDAVLGLYHQGEFVFSNKKTTLHWKANTNVINAVGNQSFNKKGDALTGQWLDQMLFLLMGAQYKCWLNFDRKYSSGDQINPFWAGALLQKERQIWHDLGFETHVVGNNVRWFNRNKIDSIQKYIKQNNGVVLYINRYGFKGEFIGIGGIKIIPPLPLIPSHFIMLNTLERKNGKLLVQFWDRDGFQTLTMSETRFNWAVFGVVAFKE